MTIGYDTLTKPVWNKKHQAIVDGKFKGRANQWTAPNLKEVRRALRQELLKKQKYRCAYCRRKIGIAQGSHQVDHVIPSSSHPHFTYTRANLVATCVRCNRIKKQHDPRWTTSSTAQAYPGTTNSWKWVHPYFHKYSEHLTILESLIFQATPGPNAANLRGRAVIKHCGLNGIRSIAIRSAAETWIATPNIYERILRTAYGNSEISIRDLSRLVKKNLKLKNNLQELESIIEGIKEGALTGAKKAVTTKFKF